MKSVMEEAPSIAKAVEQAWERVGKPREFTVKVFEEAKRSFFGFTTQSAKIALVFDERMLTEKPKTKEQRSEKRTHDRSASKTSSDRQRPKFKKSVFAKTTSDKQQYKPTEHSQQKQKTHKPQKQTDEKTSDKSKSLWTEEMVNDARTWVADNLKIMGLPNIKFDTSTQKYHLRFQFDTCVLENREKEKKLFSAFAHLIMATMRSKFKKEFRGLKVVLSSS